MLSFVINLDSSVGRMKQISTQLNQLNITFERVPAIDGRKLSETQIKKLSFSVEDREIRVRFTRDLTAGEIGCFLSHKLCWRKLIDSAEEWALIMEDDIRISSLASSYMQTDEWIPDSVKICQLSCLKQDQHGKIGTEIKKVDDNFRLVNPIYPTPLGCQAYFISREFAAEAIRLSKKLPAPVDDFLFSPWFDLSWKFKIWRINPVLVIPSSQIGSDIGSRNKKHVNKAPFFLRHGLKRFLLDMKIKKFQRAGEDFMFQFFE